MRLNLAQWRHCGGTAMDRSRQAARSANKMPRRCCCLLANRMWEFRKKPKDMQPSRMPRACAVAQPLVALLLVALSLTDVARAEEPENTADEATVELPAG